MNKKIILTLLIAALALFMLSACAKKGAKEESTTAPEDGIVYEYSNGGDSGRITASITYENGEAVSRSEYGYWETGKLKTITNYENGEKTDTWNYMYTDDGTLSDSVREYTSNGDYCRDIYEYNEAGDVTRLSNYDGDAFCGCYNYSYNTNGDVNYDEQLDRNGERIAWTEYEFSDAGRTNIAKYYQYGSLSKYWTYDYNENGDKTSVKFYSSKDELTGESRYEYNSDGNVVKALNYNADGTLTGYTESLYNENGFNYKDIYYEGGEPVYSYDYTEDGTSVYKKY